MEQFDLEAVIKKQVKELISKTIQEEIDEQTIKFRDSLMQRKDDYISEIMKGIRIFQERDINSLGINYRIIFENIYRIEDNKNENNRTL